MHFPSFACENQLYADYRGFPFLNSDATELVAAELALKERDKLLASESLAREQSIQKSNFVSNMSHEIRTPIAAM